MKRKLSKGQRKIIISVKEQQLRLLEDDREVATYPVSTSKNGTGYEEGSYRTPLGRFRVCEKIGDDSPPGTVFRGRRPTSEKADASNPDDLVVTRILWLDGLDPCNANTRGRYIYIHGTNHEESIGTPASHGCVRMRNRDVMELFDLVEPGTPVEIAP